VVLVLVLADIISSFILKGYYAILFKPCKIEIIY